MSKAVLGQATFVVMFAVLAALQARNSNAPVGEHKLDSLVSGLVIVLLLACVLLAAVWLQVRPVSNRVTRADYALIAVFFLIAVGEFVALPIIALFA